MEDILGFNDESESESSEEERAKVRNDRFALDVYTEPRKLVNFMNRMRRVPLDAIDDKIVHETYPAALWLFRSAAVCGNVNGTRALKMWLDWAQPIINSGKRRQKKNNDSPGSVAFLPREPQPGEERDDSA